MDRRNFLCNLVIGAAALPVAVKALKTVTAPVAAFDGFDCTDMDFGCSPAMGRMAEHIARTDPYAGLTFGVDSSPLRYSGPWFDGDKWRVIDNDTNQWVTL